MTIVQTRSYLLARETPLLRDQNNLCEFFKKMDKEEDVALAKDQAALDKTYSDYKNKASKDSLAVAGVSSVGAIGGGFVLSKLENDTSMTGFAIFVGIVILSGLALGYPLGKVREGEELINTTYSKINDERICRLQDKLRKIEKGLENKNSDIDEEQAVRVRDYFTLKMTEMVSFKTNQIQIRRV